MAFPADKPEPPVSIPVTPTVEVWRRMTPTEKLDFQLQAIDALNATADLMGEGRPHKNAKTRTMDALSLHFKATGRTVYLGAHEGNDPIYKKAVEELGIWIADNGNRLVYGGSDEGLMAVIADTVLAHDGDVTGIEAQMFVDRGVAHHNLTQLVVVPNIVERRTRMIELGDVFIAFPGGTGTLEEISEVVSKICLDQLTQPCIFYNLNGFYDDMKAFLQHMIDAGFSTADRQHGIYFASNLTEIDRVIASHNA